MSAVAWALVLVMAGVLLALVAVVVHTAVRLRQLERRVQMEAGFVSIALSSSLVAKARTDGLGGDDA